MDTWELSGETYSVNNEFLPRWFVKRWNVSTTVCNRLPPMRLVQWLALQTLWPESRLKTVVGIFYLFKKRLDNNSMLTPVSLNDSLYRSLGFFIAISVSAKFRWPGCFYLTYSSADIVRQLIRFRWETWDDARIVGRPVPKPSYDVDRNLLFNDAFRELVHSSTIAEKQMAVGRWILI